MFDLHEEVVSECLIKFVVTYYCSINVSHLNVKS